jgi:hypothetical protein
MLAELDAERARWACAGDRETTVGGAEEHVVHALGTNTRVHAARAGGGKLDAARVTREPLEHCLRRERVTRATGDGGRRKGSSRGEGSGEHAWP